MKNIKLTIEYDGTNYHGWQYQQNALSIQQVITAGIKKIISEQVKLIGAGRTDAGVHAKGQVANFMSNCRIPIDRLPYALNSVLPEDIVIKNAEYVSNEFHARRSAKGKEYRYYILNSQYPSALWRKYSYFYPYKLDIKKMNTASSLLIGKHDFAAFMASGSSVVSTVRTVNRLEVNKRDEIIEISIEADGFLYNMVRIIVGTLVLVGCGRLSPGDLTEIIESKEREKAGPTVPAKGLFLYRVFY